MGYAISDAMVRVDQFKPRGKWYQTLAIDMSGQYEAESPHEGLKAALLAAGHNIEQWTYVCLEPYHRYSYPVILKATDLS